VSEKNKDLTSLIKPGRPRIGKEAKAGKHLSLDKDVIAWLGDDNASGKANKILRDTMDKHDFDSAG